MYKKHILKIRYFEFDTRIRHRKNVHLIVDARQHICISLYHTS